MEPARLGLSALTLWVIVSGCAARGPVELPPVAGPQPRLVLLLLPAGVNKGYLSPYNDKVAYTPNLTRFAAQALVFDNHVTESGQSGIDYSSIFSGGDATDHGVYAHPGRMASGTYVIPAAFEDEGYETFLWVSQGMARASLSGRDVRSENHLEERLTGQPDALAAVLGRLESDPNYRALIISAFPIDFGFALQATPDADSSTEIMEALDTFCTEYRGECGDLDLSHDDVGDAVRLYLDSRNDFSRQRAQTIERLGLSEQRATRLEELIDLLYRVSISRMDAELGQIIGAVERAGRGDESLVLFAGAVGRSMRDPRSRLQHQQADPLAPELLNVPFILRAPGLKTLVGRYRQASRNMDILPTLLGLAGLQPPPEASLSGVDLAKALVGDLPEPILVARSHTPIAPPVPAGGAAEMGMVFDVLYPRRDSALGQVALTSREFVFKYWEPTDGDGTYGIFDRAGDYLETTNLADASNPLHRRMLIEIKAYRAKLLADYEARRLSGAEADDLPLDEKIHLLRATGYLD